MKYLLPLALLALGGCGGCSDGDDHPDDPVTTPAVTSAPGGGSGGTPGGTTGGGVPGGGTLPPSGATCEEFEIMPAWHSTWDAAWGAAATWEIVAGGHSGNYLRATRAAAGSSSRVRVHTLPQNTNIELAIWMKCPMSTFGYWMESGFRLGTWTAQDFDTNGTSWSLLQKFDTFGGTNGNGDAWTRYAVTFYSGAATTISIGFKLGSNPGAAPAVGFDSICGAAAGGTTTAPPPPPPPPPTSPTTFTSTGAPPDFWDTDMPASTTYHAPVVASGQLYWKLVSANYYPPGESASVGGDHHIYFQAKDQAGTLLEGQVGKSVLYDNVLYASTKGAVDGYRGDIPMFGTGWCTADIDDSQGPYSFEMFQDGLPSYRVDGMGLHCNGHMTWVLVFQKAVAP